MRKKFLFSILILPLLLGISLGESIRVVTPKSGDIWFKGEKYIIKWVNLGKIPQKVKIRLYQDDKKIIGITDSTENSGSFEWTIPLSLKAGKYYIRVKTVDNKIYDDGELFEIREAPKGKIYITSPLDGDYWQKNKKYYIRWTSQGKVNPYVKIRLYNGNGKVLGIVDRTPNNGSFLWEIPQNIEEGYYYIRVKTIDNLIYDNSDPFVITNPSQRKITVIYPNGGEKIGAPGTLEIKWKASPEIKYVRIVGIYIPEGKTEPVKQILTERENTGSFSIQMSEKIYDSKKYKVRIEDYSNPSVYDESDGYFEIYHKNKPYLKVVYPQGGESFNIGNKIEIRWEAKGFDLEVKGELWKGNGKIGTIFENLTMNQALEGKRLWTVGETKGGKVLSGDNNYFIKLIAKNKSSLWSSSGLFSIQNRKETCSLKIIYTKLLKNRYNMNDNLDYFIKVKNMGSYDFKGDILPIVSYIGVKRKVYHLYKNQIIKKGATSIFNINSILISDFVSKGGTYRVEFGIEGWPEGDKNKKCEDLYKERLTIFVSSETKESYDLKATNCAYTKNAFIKGETATFSITPYNSGPSTVSGYKITAWSVRGDGTGHIMIRGRTNFSDRRQTVLKSGQSKMEYFKVKINDSPGDYTLFVKVESGSPSASLDRNKSNNVCKIRYKVVYRTKVLSTYNKRVLLSFPDLTFDRVRTKIGVNGIEAVIKNLKYKSAKLPLPEVKKIYVRIINTSKKRFSKNTLEFFLPKFVIKELNERGETDYISRLNIVFPEAKLIVDSKNNIIESNENNNSINIK